LVFDGLENDWDNLESLGVQTGQQRTHFSPNILGFSWIFSGFDGLENVLDDFESLGFKACQQTLHFLLNIFGFS